MNKRGMNRRGQEWWWMLTLLLGLVLVVLAILFFTGFFDKLNTAVGVLPGDLEIVTQACKLAVSANLATSYCKDFKEVEMVAGGKQWVNCQYNEVRDTLDKADVPNLNPSCGNDEPKALCQNLKTQLKETYHDNVLVNGRSCKDREVSEETAPGATDLAKGKADIA